MAHVSLLPVWRFAPLFSPIPTLTSVTRRHRHGRSIRVTAGVFPRSAVGRDRVNPVAQAAAARLTRLTGAGRPGSTIPAFEVDVAELPSRDQVARYGPSDVTSGALLSAHRTAEDGALVITVFARPVLLWATGTGVSLPHLVRQALAEQLATAVGVEPGDLDPEVD